jgi:hypothetical protein
MSGAVVLRWGGVVLALSAVAFGLGGVLVAVDSAGGLGGPQAGLAYYTGLVLAPPGLAALYGAQIGQTGKLGLVGYVLASMGAVLYATGAFLILPIADQIPAAHDLWIYAMARVPVIPLGGALFLVGSGLLGVAAVRARVLPRWAAMLYTAGAVLWLVAFFGGTGLAFLLPIANWIGGIGLVWIGWILASANLPRRAVAAGRA